MTFGPRYKIVPKNSAKKKAATKKGTFKEKKERQASIQSEAAPEK
jgi:hypothetical protein